MTGTTAYIGLGSNLGDREGFIKAALKMFEESPDIKVVAVSDLIQTVPLGSAEQPNYINAVAQIETILGPEDLYKRLSEIEISLGRVRKEKWSSRTIDLDLLLFGQQMINLEHLTVPHPQMHLRSFVLKGLCRLNGRLLHPVLKESMDELASRLGGLDFALRPDAPQLISVAGIIGVGKTTVTKSLSKKVGSRPLLESYDKNPFLPDVYAGKKKLALDSQLFFLAGRIEQLEPKRLGTGRIWVSDYIFEKELIYARALLTDFQLTQYKRIYPSNRSKVASPVLVIYLQDSPENCLQRIRMRNRPYEQAIELQFLERLSSDYEKLFGDWKISPVIRISMSEFDCSRNGDIEHLTNQIKSYVAAQWKLQEQ